MCLFCPQESEFSVISHIFWPCSIAGSMMFYHIFSHTAQWVILHQRLCKHKNWLVQGLQCFLYQPSPWTLLIHSPLGHKVRTGLAPFSSKLRYREVRGDRAHLWPHTVKVSGWVWNLGNFFSSFWFFSLKTQRINHSNIIKYGYN